MKIEKTSVAMSRDNWYFLNNNRRCGESMEKCIMRLISYGSVHESKEVTNAEIKYAPKESV